MDTINYADHKIALNQIKGMGEFTQFAKPINLLYKIVALSLLPTGVLVQAAPESGSRDRTWFFEVSEKEANSLYIGRIIEVQIGV